MEENQFLNSFLNLLERYKTSLILALLGLIFVGVGLVLPNLNKTKEEIVVQKPSDTSSSSQISIDVAGAVNKPGVYKLADGSRVLDAIYEAGGFSNEVDSDWLAKDLNLAAKVIDGQKVYINKIGEAANTNSSVSGMNNKGKINVNTASLKELDTLPGVGEVTANKIVASRPYKSVEELLSKKVVGQSTFNKLKDLVSVY